MTLRVECYAGFEGEQEPRAFYLGERRVEVLEVADRWFGARHRWYRCRTDDGHSYVLRHDEASGEWDIAAFTRAAGPA
jgi:hypothetical protein